MKEKLTKEEIGFTQIKNEVLQDKNLSFKAKGIFCLIYSKPDDWDFSVKRLAFESKDEYKSINSGIKELEENGYLERHKLSNGRKEWYIKFSQVAKKPSSRNGNLPKRQLDKTDTISNKEELVINIKQSNKDFATTVAADISKVIKMFEIVNPSISSLYGNKTQRASAARLLKKWTLNQIKTVVNILPELNADRYAKGKSITPYELEKNLGFIEAWIKSKNNNKLKIATISKEDWEAME